MSQISTISLRERLDAMPSVADAARLQGQRSFEKALGRAQSASPAPKSTRDEARAAAEELVARALVQPILAKMRESRDTAEPFGQNEVERAFGSISDTQFADRLTKSGNWTLVDVVAKRIMNAGKSGTNPGISGPIENARTDAARANPTDTLAPLSIAAWAGARKVAR